MIRSRGRIVAVAAAVASVAVIGAFLAPGVAALDGPGTEPAVEEGSSFVVALDADGDATVALVLTYDLADADDEAAFEELRERPENVTDRFDDRMTRIAERTAAETGREMSVSDVRAEVESTDGTGVVRLSATWANLAAVDGDRLVVSEPFESAFRPDRPFVLVAPDGYVLADATVEADATTRTDGTGAAIAEWSPGTDLSGFSAAFAPAETGGVTEGSLPTPLVPTLALLAAGLLGYAGWRRA
ncbi:DUF7345 domain-containing protein [Halorubrum lipolyticum]|uniref:DUF7345 domain-containing protein n=1 Tax=Halorubrum lipolyticum DSM 21995 TaxID=1227482 RepID=M0NVE5_9EURY|nr:hypothetical protein [Halorubrum lipolyticum]EMA61513.1 hypothetical protein C469_07446 [Halorubrum lipolyticum DSM 21995]